LGIFGSLSICEDECKDELNNNPVVGLLGEKVCCQAEYLYHDGEKGYNCMTFSSASTQWAKFDKSTATCIRDEMVTGDDVLDSN